MEAVERIIVDSEQPLGMVGVVPVIDNGGSVRHMIADQILYRQHELALHRVQS